MKKGFLFIFIAFLTLFAIFTSNNIAVTKPQSTLCQTNEKVYFSCSVKGRGNKTVSLCGSKKLTKTSGSLQYRYGTKKKVELKHPASNKGSQKAFTGFNQMYSGGHRTWVEFHKGKYHYALFDELIKITMRNKKAASGIEILLPGGKKVRKLCLDKNYINNLYEAVEVVNQGDVEKSLFY